MKAGNTANILESVINGELDMGFVEGNINDMDIKKQIIGSDELIIVTSNPEFNSKRWQT